MENICKIDLYIDDENEILASLDYNKDTLSPDVVEYIYSKISIKNFGQKIQINIYSQNHLDEDKIRHAFNKTFEDEIVLCENSYHALSIKQIWIALSTVVFLALFIVIKIFTGSFMADLFSVISSFSMWSLLEIWILDKPDIRQKIVRLEYYRDTVINFIKI